MIACVYWTMQTTINRECGLVAYIKDMTKKAYLGQLDTVVLIVMYFVSLWHYSSIEMCFNQIKPCPLKPRLPKSPNLLDKPL